MPEERDCPTCLRSVHLRENEVECYRCTQLRSKPELDERDALFLAKAVMRHVKKQIGYWPPRWARDFKLSLNK